MSDYKIAICDDTEVDRNYIKDIVSNWARQSGHSVDICLFSSAEEFLFEYEEDKSYQILLLDIEMGKMDGVTMAKKIRKTSDSAQIVFITGYSDYIAEGYEVAALHYLMKPVKEDKLFEVLDRAAKKISKDGKVLILESGGEIDMVPIYRIRYVDVRANYITVHADKDITVKKTLSEIEKELDERFFRVGRSCIVNLTCISRVTKTDIYFNDGGSVQLPRGSYEKVNRAIINNS
ncbi:two component transcriptional regulator, LytTR family [Butyrivibrio fibrisolvens DSM 3071]|uniref:Stage 0 sporulation protein A homolog n=1 Tax=Butyrivibrio fibrisolvens DSM 3071 TaxID=1121131 RepID=A0A1M5U1N2_BUTFI|nr:LytTR family DNA-binding domain-containing protein [Butyrivibrio fibrisolvens]SHH56771.1 two component transcriptional regulator, LytTR family [Butyrivibrio fibrisolvens DSM 3071]